MIRIEQCSFSECISGKSPFNWFLSTESTTCTVLSISFNEEPSVSFFSDSFEWNSSCCVDWFLSTESATYTVLSTSFTKEPSFTFFSDLFKWNSLCCVFCELIIKVSILSNHFHKTN